jgi:hypothetical protein
MANKNTGGSAFPIQDAYSMSTEQGMTLRDYFAAQALTGMQIWDSVLNGKEAYFSGSKGGPPLLAETAYLVADAMLKARDENN